MGEAIACVVAAVRNVNFSHQHPPRSEHIYQKVALAAGKVLVLVVVGFVWTVLV